MSPPAGNPRVSPTAWATAHVWARAGFEGAARFDTPRGTRLMGALRALTFAAGPLLPPPVRHLEEGLIARHHAFEDRLAQLAPRVVLEVGAGLSARGLARAAADPALTWIEGDLPQVVAFKRGLLGADTPPNYHLVPIDLLGEGVALPVPAPPGLVVLVEGVVDYLDHAEKARAFRNLADLLRAAGGGTWLLELNPLDRLDRWPVGAALSKAVLGGFVGRSFEGRLYGSVAEGLSALREAGFDHAAAVDLAALGRPPLAEERRIWELVEARVAG